MTKAELIKALEKSEETRRQIYGTLIDVDFLEGNKVENINGYCALGALACEKKLFKDDTYFDGGRHILEPDYDDIIEAYGVENNIGENKHCPECDISLDSLSSLIPHFNDRHKFSFGRIAKELKKIKIRSLRR